jgi:riboflavin kinase / FMN adenylyltransferase
MNRPFRIFRSLEEAGGRFGPSVLTVGNFDGVHAGHRRILRRVAALAGELGFHPSVLTFDPHPATVVAPHRAPLLLTTPEDRASLMAGEGIAQVLILPFTLELSRLSPEAFARDILSAGLDARAVLVGDNFRFGYKHAGDTHMLAELGRQCGFEVEVIPGVRRRGRMVSSSEVRRLIREGNVGLAGRLLERCYTLAGEVVRGQGIGSKQTVPTLNLAPAAGMLPANGVYITRTTDTGDGRIWPSVTNVGRRPTFGGDNVTVETFLLEPIEGASPGAIRVEFLRRLREERKFDNPAALKAQIFRDVSRAKAYFRRLNLTAETQRTERKTDSIG